MGSSDWFDVLNQGFNLVTTTVGVIANTLLLFAIRRRRNLITQTYSILLMNTTTVDLIGTIIGILTTARIVSNHLVSITYIIFTGPCSIVGATICQIFYALQNQMYTTSNYFLCFAFAFRLCSIYSNSPNKKSVLIASLLIHFSNFSIGFAAFSLFSDNNSDMNEFVGLYPQYGRMIDAGYALGAVHYSSVKSFLTALFIVLSSPIVFSTAFFLRSRTMRALKRTSFLMSSSTKEVHRMFVRTLNFQLALTTFVGIGSGIYVLNLMGWITHPLSEITPCAIANLLPSVAPIFNLWCIRPYRTFVKDIARQWLHPSKVTLLRGVAFTSSYDTSAQLGRNELSKF